MLGSYRGVEASVPVMVKRENMMGTGAQVKRIVKYDVTDGISFEEFGTSHCHI